jgi:type IV pilus assembly protein PilM
VSAVVALDIGSSAIAGVEVDVAKDGVVRLQKALVEPMPMGLVHDGEVVDGEGLAQEIKHFWRASRFSGRKVRLGVANQRVVVRNIDIPPIEDPEERRAAVESEAAELLPTVAGGSVIDYQPILRYREGDAERERCVVVAAQRDMLLEVARVVKKAGLQPVGIDLEAFAILRAVLPPPPFVDDGSMDSPAEVVCHVGAETTNIVVSVDRRCHFTRLVAFGGNHLTQAVAERAEVPFEEAEAMKRACGLLGAPPADWDATLVAEVRHALALSARPLAREISRSLEYYRSGDLARPVSRLVLTGGTALCVGLERYLAQGLGIPAVVGDVRPNLEGAEELEPEVAARAAVAVGLAIEAGDAA